MDTLKSVFPIDLIYNGYCFKFTAIRSSLDSYDLFINGSKCSVGVRALSDGGLLILLSGQSHSIYWKEVGSATRLSVDGKICLLEQETDRAKLRTPSPGKLVRYVIKDGVNIKAGEAFAEVEIMKMHMPLLAQEDGIVQLIKQPGTMLEAGDVLGILALNDASRVKQAAQPFLDHLPSFDPPLVEGIKLAQRFRPLYNILKNILDGFDNQLVMRSILDELIDILRDPQLPYSEWSACFSALYSRIPQHLLASLKQIIDGARARKSDFPAKSLSKAVQKFWEGTAADDVVLLKILPR